MTEKEPPAGEKDAETMGADDPYDLKGLLKPLGTPWFVKQWIS